MPQARITKSDLETKAAIKKREAEAPERFTCPVDAALSVVGGKWKLMIVHELLEHIYRHGELLRLLPGITQKVLTQQLRELERDGVVERRVYEQVPPKVEYSLTEFGRTLDPIVKAADAWGRQYADKLIEIRR